MEELYNDLSLEAAEHIFDVYGKTHSLLHIRGLLTEHAESGISSAAEEAIETIQRWGMKVDRTDREAGGYAWATYKAICRRQGVYSNAQGPHEWNGKLTSPLLKAVASGWEKAFSRRLPMVLASFVRNANACLKQFHKDIDSRARKMGVGIASLHTLSSQLDTYGSSLKDISVRTAERINTAQKDINREFVPVVADAMETAYDDCTAANGESSCVAARKLSMP